MAILNDLSHIFGNDLDVTPSGDIALASNATRTTQRVIRRLLTPQTTQDRTGYPWQPEYGAGLPQHIGEAGVEMGVIQSTVLSQLLLEDSVARTPIPAVTVTEADAGGKFAVDTTYTDLTGTPQSFGFDLG